MFTPQSRIGLIIARFLSVDFAIATCLGLWHLFGIGTCASGGPFEIANQCTDSAMTWGLVFAAGLTGSIIVSFFTGFAWGWAMMFVPTGATAIAFALFGDPGIGADTAAWIIGPLFLLMGLPAVAFAIKEAVGDDDFSPDDTTRQRAENYFRSTASVSPFATAATVAAPAQSTGQQLARLDALKSTGALTDTEYEAQKRAMRV